ncbi:Nitrogenase iron-iron accessory protein AnfO [Methanolacinia petrolearia DSM 11571]|uniref:Nitrogenase iron-iron accessory protein AnfO n=1 Tax=Methanolacinia petrolearia (strain DSM 11571 / OCM 486 / SEBR 4847) TaxID=679926 RepID=E1RF85_METP4|nr:Fe-only nitrogenase accessory AnfO family protein [Methanolacinia petrolearia]ADN35033.1 Nitrogenase iron-iron accessory protein AnfO [Methanolacinia petrolearia DSM 11571]
MCPCEACEGNKTEVAVILGSEGTTGILSEPGTVRVYERGDDCSWQPIRETGFEMKGESLQEIRLKISGLMDFLGDCRIFVARAASGAVFFELQKAGFSIWEIEGRPAEFLDDVVEEEEAEEKAGKSTVFEIPAPLEISPNNYTISIKDVQGKIPGISSKKILQHFVRTGDFERLEVICDHVPPWIELDAVMSGLDCESEKTGPGEYLVVLTPKRAES